MIDWTEAEDRLRAPGAAIAKVNANGWIGSLAAPRSPKPRGLGAGLRRSLLALVQVRQSRRLTVPGIS